MAFTLGCAVRKPRCFPPAGEEEALRALAAWRTAVARAEALGPARVLYDARLSQGVLRIRGTLAVRQSPGSVEATLTGPFGTVVARYADGALRGDGMKSLVIAPEQLRWLLAGVWEAEMPAVLGVDGLEALLRWSETAQVEGVLDVAAARFRSLRVERPEGTIVANYSGANEPWPERIEVEDVKTGNTLRLALIGQETLER